MWIVPNTLNAEIIPYSQKERAYPFRQIQAKFVDASEFTLIVKRTSALNQHKSFLKAQAPKHRDSILKRSKFAENDCILWRTPLAALEITRGSYRDKSKLLSVEASRQHSLTGQVMRFTHSQSVDYLNPRWIESLMGLPIGWAMRHICVLYSLHNKKDRVSHEIATLNPPCR